MAGPPEPRPDERIVYGAHCTWWDSIDKVGAKLSRADRRHPSSAPVLGLPVCPFCGSVLFEVESEAVWWAAVDKHDQESPGYREMIAWARGRCFPNYSVLELTYLNVVPGA